MVHLQTYICNYIHAGYLMSIREDEITSCVQKCFKNNHIVEYFHRVSKTKQKL